MFNLQGGELVIVLLLALVVLGPEKLPEAMRKAGKFYGELRRMSSSFQSEFRKAVEEPVNEFRKAVDEPLREVKDTANLLREAADLTDKPAPHDKPKSAEMSPVEMRPAEAAWAEPDRAPEQVVEPVETTGDPE